MTITRVPNSILESPVNANLLINPSFTVQQRGAVIDHAANSYGPDRWKVRGLTYVGGTMSQSSTSLDATTGVNKLKVEHSNATSYSFLSQNIEAVNIYGLYGSEITFSFSYSDSGSGDPLVEINSYDSGSTVKTLFYAVPTDLGGGRWSCTCTLSTDDGTFPDPSDIGLQLVIYPNEFNTAPDEWYVWETKLEAGSEATPFVARPYSEELDLCRRYYERQVVYNASAVRGSLSGSGTAVNVFNTFYPKRALPSVTFGTGPDDLKMEITGDGNKQTGIRFVWRSPSSIAAGFVYSVTYTAHFDSEL